MSGGGRGGGGGVGSPVLIKFVHMVTMMSATVRSPGSVVLAPVGFCYGLNLEDENRGEHTLVTLKSKWLLFSSTYVCQMELNFAHRLDNTCSMDW